MIHYKKFIQFLEQQHIAVQLCKTDQTTSQDSVLGYQVEQHSQVVMMHQLQALEQKIYIFVEQGASLSLQVFEQLIAGSTKFELHIILLQDAQFYMNFAFIHASEIDCSINVYLEGDRAKADIQGLYALNSQQRVSINTYQYHAGIDSQSNLAIKGMLTDCAQASYHGLIKIDESAKRADASQAHKNITLSAGARVISVPTIEVLQYDVQCCHGSAIGKFDADDMWYLQSKGILPGKAQEMLVRSFFLDVLAGSNNGDEMMDVLCQKMI